MQDEMELLAIGLRLKECRLSLKLSQPEVAAKLGRTPQAISKWEKGGSMPSGRDWQVLGKLYGVSLDYLVYGVRTMPVSDYAATMATIFRAPGVNPSGAVFGAPERCTS